MTDIHLDQKMQLQDWALRLRDVAQEMEQAGAAFGLVDAIANITMAADECDDVLNEMDDE
jgi:hypothetical protein